MVEKQREGEIIQELVKSLSPYNLLKVQEMRNIIHVSDDIGKSYHLL